MFAVGAVVVLYTASASPVLAQTAAARDVAEVRRTIESTNDVWVAAFNSGDTRAMSAVYTPDANLFPLSNVRLQGRASILEYLVAQRGLGMKNPRLQTLEVVTMGDVAYEMGAYTVGYSTGPDSSRSDSGKYMVVWKLQSDGSWRYHVGIWTAEPATG